MEIQSKGCLYHPEPIGFEKTKRTERETSWQDGYTPVISFRCHVLHGSKTSEDGCPGTAMPMENTRRSMGSVAITWAESKGQT